jgi:hypothetical protein
MPDRLNRGVRFARRRWCGARLSDGEPLARCKVVGLVASDVQGATGGCGAGTSMLLLSESLATPLGPAERGLLDLPRLWLINAVGDECLPASPGS